MLIHRGLDVVLGTLADMGYDAAWGVISAADCGANHLRKRVWILAYATHTNDSKGPDQDHGAEWAQIKPRGSGSSSWKSVSFTGDCDDDGYCQDVAHGLGSRLEGYAGNGKDLDGQGRLFEEQERPTRESGLRGGGSCSEIGNSQPGLGGMVDGLAAGMDCNHVEFADWWEAEPEIPRVCPSQPARAHRLKAIGNGQVPRVAATAWVTLEKILWGDG